jgi:tetratricopeptide (TPR) repeat protein
LALVAGDHEEARAHYRTLLRESTAAGDPVSTQYALCGLGDVALTAGHTEEAVGHYRRALQSAIEEGELEGAERILLSMAKLSAKRGEQERAAELLAVAYHIVSPNGWERVGPCGGREFELELRAHLSPDIYAAAQARGRARDVRETLAALLSDLG